VLTATQASTFLPTDLQAPNNKRSLVKSKATNLVHALLITFKEEVLHLMKMFLAPALGYSNPKLVAIPFT
jgi:hypothetical protein